MDIEDILNSSYLKKINQENIDKDEFIKKFSLLEIPLIDEDDPKYREKYKNLFLYLIITTKIYNSYRENIFEILKKYDENVIPKETDKGDVKNEKKQKQQKQQKTKRVEKNTKKKKVVESESENEEETESEIESEVDESEIEEEESEESEKVKKKNTRKSSKKTSSGSKKTSGSKKPNGQKRRR